MGKRNLPAALFDSSQIAARASSPPQSCCWVISPLSHRGAHSIHGSAPSLYAHDKHECLASSEHVSPVGYQLCRAPLKRPKADPSSPSLSLSLLE